MENILREILAKDKSILGRRDELIEALDKKVPTSLMRDYTPIKRAVKLNVAEIFLYGESNKDATKGKVKEILKASGMQEARIDFVLETFTKALDWGAPRLHIPKVNTVKLTKEAAKEVPPPIRESTRESTRTIEPPTAEVVEHANATTRSEPAASNSTNTPNVDETVEQVAQNLDDLQTQIVAGTPTPTPAQIQNQIPPPPLTPPQDEETLPPLPQNHKTKIFTMEGRLNRWAYFKQELKIFVLLLIGAATAEILIGIPILIAAVVGGWMVTIRRLHDLDKSGWWVLVLCIPYVSFIFGLYVLFAPGTKGYNRYGADPLLE